MGNFLRYLQYFCNTIAPAFTARQRNGAESTRIIAAILHFQKRTGSIAKRIGRMKSIGRKKKETASIEQCMLEVITTNEPALKNYEALGFNVNRIFDCFRGAVKPVVKPLKGKITIRNIAAFDLVTIKSFGEELPSWQNSLAGANRNQANNRQLGVYINEELVGYGIVQPTRGRIIQFAIAEAQRRQGLGHRLLWEMSRLSQTPLSIMNVDQAYSGTNKFLKAVGLVQTISQFEMIKTLN